MCKEASCSGPKGLSSDDAVSHCAVSIPTIELSKLLDRKIRRFAALQKYIKI